MNIKYYNLSLYEKLIEYILDYVMINNIKLENFVFISNEKRDNFFMDLINKFIEEEIDKILENSKWKYLDE